MDYDIPTCDSLEPDWEDLQDTESTIEYLDVTAMKMKPL